ncbi:collagen alpha-1(I) chain-like [Ranitomeya imitator]|uniref:collagen alpha-1(I) chain-like n=1 Tax=Ranitomeya imitator TaxID=111125 RepID=UPI0037E8A778
MESLRSVISSMERGEFLASIDIKDAYLHIPIFPPHQRFLRFAIREDHFQFTALPFGLATAPRVFTKVMAAVMAILHSRGVVVLPYLDDLLIKGPSFQACESSVHITLDSLSRLGWLINLDKSSPVPSRRISFLGMILDTSRGAGFASSVQGPSAPTGSPYTLPFLPANHSVRHEDPGKDGCGNRSCSLRSTPSPPFATGSAGQLGQESLFSRPPLPSVPTGQTFSHLVDPGTVSSPGEVLPPDPLVSGNHRRQSSGLGGGVSSPLGPGPLDCSGIQSPHQHSGDSCYQTCSDSLPRSARGSPSTSPIGQRHGGGLHQPPGGYPQQGGNEGSLPHPSLGRDQPLHLGGAHSGSRELGGGLPEPPGPCLGGVGTSPRSFSPDLSSLGDPGRGSDGVQMERQSPQLHCSISGSPGHRSGRADFSVASFSAPICVSSSSLTAEGHPKDQDGGSSGHSGRPRLASSRVVRGTRPARSRRPLAVARPPRPTSPRTDLPSELRGPTFNGVAVETWILARAGFSQQVIPTMLSARKASSASIYHRVWKTFFSWCRLRGHPPLRFSIPCILNFLQSGLDSGLALSSLKGCRWRPGISTWSWGFSRNRRSNPFKTFRSLFSLGRLPSW